MKNNGGSAFPKTVMFERDGIDRQDVGPEGMTLRDYFAAKAMAAILSLPESEINKEREVWTTALEQIATVAFIQADAMLKERDKQ